MWLGREGVCLGEDEETPTTVEKEVKKAEVFLFLKELKAVMGLSVSGGNTACTD